MPGQKQKKPVGLYLLLICMFFLALSGLSGGIALLIDPSGALIQMPLSLLARTPFKNFFLPALILFSALGIYPALVFYGLRSPVELRWLKIINIYPEQNSAWTSALYVGIILVLWINFQIYLIGGGHYLQFIYALLGVLIIILTLLPSVKRYFLLAKD